MDHTDLRSALSKLGGYKFLNTGHDEEHNVTWAKMRYRKDATGHRSLEFLAWLTTDISRAGDPLYFFPTAAPPYLNDPGEVLSFVIEIYRNDMKDSRFDETINFINDCYEKYYGACKA